MGHTDDQLDVAAVERYLDRQISGFSGPITVHKFATGQSNPTYRLDTPTAQYVLRRKPPGVLLKSAHAVDREFRIQTALANTDVPVPTMLHLCSDDSVIGSMFYVMGHVEGRNFVEPTMDGLDNPTRGAVMNEVCRVLAALHSIDPETVGLADYGPPGHYLERQITRWTQQYYAAETEKRPEMDQLIMDLTKNLPADDGRRSLVHGDYRIDNMIFATEGAECLAVLDWELSTIGHPFADLASVIMQWQLPPGTEGRGLAGVDRHSLGLPSDHAFIQQYCDHMNLPEISDFGTYLGFSFFRMAAILQGVLKRGLDGNASNPEKALMLGQYVPLFARHGLKALNDG
ncbi:MAG: phosphotransferase family protein [Paracoccaceae bacterium]